MGATGTLWDYILYQNPSAVKRESYLLSVQLFEEETSVANNVRSREGEHSPEPETTHAPPETSGSAPAERPSVRTLGDDHASLTHRLRKGGLEGALVVGLFDDGAPGEVMLAVKKPLPALDAFTEALNLALAYGVPAGPLAEKLAALVTGSEAEAARHIAAWLREKFPA